MGKKQDSEMVQGLYMGIRQRAIWFHLLLEEAKKQGCDIEKLTDDAIFQYGVGVSAGEKGDEPKDLLHHMCSTEGPFWEMFDKEILCEEEDKCIARFHRCPLVDAWREYGLSDERINELCNLANKGDFGRASNFCHANMEFPKRIGGGDDYCELYITRK